MINKLYNDFDFFFSYLLEVTCTLPGVFAFRGFLCTSISEIVKNKNLSNESLNILIKNYYFEILVLKYIKNPRSANTPALPTTRLNVQKMGHF